MPSPFRSAVAALTTACLTTACLLAAPGAAPGAAALVPTEPADAAGPAEPPPAQRVVRAGPPLQRLQPLDRRDVATVLAGMSLRQRVGQLFMVGTPADRASSATAAHVSERHVGSVMLTGRSHGGTGPPARVVAAMQARVGEASTAGVPLLVSTDQEGGAVRVLQGPGFTAAPSALEQGRWAPPRLRAAAAGWAEELRGVGVTMNLAPVLDTVPGPEAAAGNAPIGAHDRQFGYDVDVVAAHGLAFARGMADRGVVPVVKHFPGLGRVRGNTDLVAGVTDHVTRRHDRYLAPFRAAVDAGMPVVMMSTAYYARLDPRNPAAFSRFVVRRMLRGDLGFRGVVVSDDLASARQVARWTPAERAMRFLRAGGDLVLTVDPATLPAMYDAVLARARTSAAFRARLDRSVVRVLRLKESQGLLPSAGGS